jgi:Zn-dependent protease
LHPRQCARKRTGHAGLDILEVKGGLTMRGTIQIGRVLDIPIGIHFSWFLPLAFVLYMLGTRFYPEVLPREPAWQHWALAAATGLLFFACVVLHELGHSVVARYFKIPVRSITLFVLGGVAQITRDATRPMPELLMALAGPAVSILLGGVFMALWWFGGQGTNATSTMWEWLWIMNLGLGIFNMMPAFPMDGGRVLRASLWGVTRSLTRATTIAVWVGRALAWALIAVGVLATFDSPLLPDEFSAITGVQFILIGWFLMLYAGAGLRQVRTLDALSRHRVGDAMVRGVPAVYLGATAREMLNGPLAGYGAGRDWVFVSGDGRFAGLAPRAAIERVPDAQQDLRVAADLMIPAARLHPIAPDATLADVLQHFQDDDLRVMPVVADGEVVGLVHEGTIARALNGRTIQ